MWCLLRCSCCPLSTCCPSALRVPPPCVTFLQADVTLVPVNLAVLLRPIGNGSFCIPRQRFRDVSPLSETLTAGSFWVFFSKRKLNMSYLVILYFTGSVWSCRSSVIILGCRKRIVCPYLFTMQDAVKFDALCLSSFHFSAVKYVQIHEKCVCEHT